MTHQQTKKNGDQVKEVTQDYISEQYDNSSPLRWQSAAIMALQEAAEAYMVHLFEDAYRPLSLCDH